VDKEVYEKGGRGSRSTEVPREARGNAPVAANGVSLVAQVECSEGTRNLHRVNLKREGKG